MRINKYISEFMTAFFVCTTCITILEGILGMIFFRRRDFLTKLSFPLRFLVFSPYSSGLSQNQKRNSV